MATPSDDSTFELIENVQEEQCLWDRGDELFKDAKYKKAVWADIASKVGYACKYQAFNMRVCPCGF